MFHYYAYVLQNERCLHPATETRFEHRVDNDGDAPRRKRARGVLGDDLQVGNGRRRRPIMRSIGIAAVLMVLAAVVLLLVVVVQAGRAEAHHASTSPTFGGSKNFFSGRSYVSGVAMTLEERSEVIADRDIPIRVLAPVEVKANGGSASLGVPKQKAPLALLVARVGRNAPRTRRWFCGVEPPASGSDGLDLRSRRGRG